MNRFAFTIAKNATANIVRGGASAIVALVLPHFLTKAFDHDRFAAWALMLQIAAYANYLDFGIQTAVARYLAQAIERGDDEERDKLISTAFAMLAIAGAAALVVIGSVVWQLPHIFHAISLDLVADLRLGLAVMAASVAFCFSKRSEPDVQYAREWSSRLDEKILMKTPACAFHFGWCLPVRVWPTQFNCFCERTECAVIQFVLERLASWRLVRVVGSVNV